MTVTALRIHQGRPVVALSAVPDMNAAEALAGAELRVPVSSLPRLPEGTFYQHDLVGCRVETVDGTAVGEVDAVEGAGGESRLVLKTAAGEVLIPLVEAICTTIDTPGRRIVIAPPPGLLGLNVRSGGR